MSAFLDDHDLTDALQGLKSAALKVREVAGRGDAELCEELVGIVPQLRELEAQLRGAQSALRTRRKKA